MEFVNNSENRYFSPQVWVRTRNNKTKEKTTRINTLDYGLNTSRVVESKQGAVKHTKGQREELIKM